MSPFRTSLDTGSVLRVAGIAISQPEGRIDAAPDYTKLDVVRYHERVARWLVPQLAPRPIVVMKLDARRDDPPAEADVDAIDEPPRSFIRVSDIADVVRIVQNGSWEFHTRGASFPRLERPDRIILDLDPDPRLPFHALAEAAMHLHALLVELGFAGFVKTTGGRGLHVAVPLTRRHSWGETHMFARAIAFEMERRHADLVSTSPDTNGRPRVHIEYDRNAEGATTIAAYSMRACKGLPVSMPIAWDELASMEASPHFDIDSAAAAVERRTEDPWQSYDRSRQTISGAMRRAVGA
jgi:bifunctional non-homologous end joining protein LigD